VPDALWMNCPATGGAPEYTAAELRQDMAFAGLWGGRDLGARQGVRPGGSQWGVTLAGTTLTVAPGVGLVDPGLTIPQGPYWVALPAAETHTLTPAHATSARKDIVVVRVYDHDEDGSGLRVARSEYLTGVAGPSPAEPAVPAGALRIAGIDVPASGGGNPAVTSAPPYTVAPGGLLPVRNQAEQSAIVPYPGLAIWRLDGPGLLVWSGTAWLPLQTVLTALTTGMNGRKFLAGTATNIASVVGQTHTTTTVPFGATFPTVPVVLVTQSEHTTVGVYWHLDSVSTTQFVLAIGRSDGEPWGTAINYDFDWLAIG
jgi:hypothetical protein